MLRMIDLVTVPGSGEGAEGTWEEGEVWKCGSVKGTEGEDGHGTYKLRTLPCTHRRLHTALSTHHASPPPYTEQPPVMGLLRGTNNLS